MAASECFLITHWGTLVCYSQTGRALVQRPPSELTEVAHPAAFEMDGSILRSVQQPLDEFHVVRGSASGLISLRRNGLFLCAAVEGDMHTSRVTASDWESFLLITKQDLDAVQFLLRNSWIDGRSHRLQHGGNTMLVGFRLQIGSLVFDLRDNVPLMLTEDGWERDLDVGTPGFRTCTLWLNGWQPVRLSLYRPLVFYCAFGRAALEQFSVSVHSLRELGAYQGDLLVLSNAMPDQVATYAASWPAGRLHVMTFAADDKLDFCSARYRIADWPEALQFQPLLYLDADVVFDLDPSELLIQLAVSGKMTAQREQHSHLSTHSSMGASMFLEAGIVLEPKQEGLNSGIIGISHMAAHRQTIKLIYEGIYRFVEAKRDRLAMSHFDQPMANYIAHISGCFDLDILTPRVRWFHTDELHGGPFRLGFVHFWGAHDKPAELRRYVASLTDQS